jgi:hypothetical protein
MSFSVKGDYFETCNCDGSLRKATVGAVISMESTEILGMDGSHPPVITNPLLGAVAQAATRLHHLGFRSVI